MSRIENLAANLSYEQITYNYSKAAEKKAEAVAEQDMLKAVLVLKMRAGEGRVSQQTSQHEPSGENLVTTSVVAGFYEARIKEQMKASKDFDSVEEQIRVLLATNIAQGDTQVSRREVLREILQIVEGAKGFSKSETVEIVMR